VGQGQFSKGLKNLCLSGQTMEDCDLSVARGHTFLRTIHAHHRHGELNQSTCSVKE